MNNLNLKVILENAVKEREAYIEKYPHLEAFQTIIDSHLKDHTGMNERFFGLLEAARTYKEKTGVRGYQHLMTE
jgi:hypothetical protein